MRYLSVGSVLLLLSGCDGHLLAAFKGFGGAAKSSADEADSEEVDCVDGINSETGEECDGGPEANRDDGECEDGKDENGETCTDEEDEDDGECEDGKDENGQPCTDEDEDDGECENGKDENGQPCTDE